MFVCQAGLKIIDFASVCCLTVCVCVCLKGELAHTLGMQAVAVATAMGI